MTNTSYWLTSIVALTFAAPAIAEVPQAVLDAQKQRIETVNKVRPSVVAVFGPGGAGGGSGVVISPDGFALTNFHVVKPAGDAMKCGLDDGKLYDAVIVSIDPTGDVALIKLLGRDDFPCAELGDSDKVRVGDWSFAMGNPFLLASDFTPTVTYGIVSGVHRYQYPAGTILEYADCIQIDTSINPGNSGGPLFDAQGRLIGINGRGSFEKRGRVNVGVGYAISINQIKNFLGHLKSGAILDHATLGAQVGMSADGEVVVSNILESSDAYRRGLRYGDQIVSFAGRPIRTVNAFKNALGVFPKGWRVPITFRHEGEKRTAYVRLAGVHRTGELEAKLSKGRAPRQAPPPKAQPKDDDKGKDAPKGQPQPRPVQLPTQQLAPMPKIAKDHYEARAGYKNYYFNRVNQKRVWDSLTTRGDFSTLTGTWVLTGTDANGAAIRLAIDPAEVSASLPAGDVSEKITDNLREKLGPPGSGGMFAALALWQRLLVKGPQKFGEIRYLGTLPLPEREGLFDVLVGTTGEVECYFYVRPGKQHGELVAVEMFPAEDKDPCVLLFDGYAEVEGRSLPHKLEVRHGDLQYAQFQFDQFKLDHKPEE